MTAMALPAKVVVGFQVNKGSPLNFGIHPDGEEK
jgi:hypothetical protein